MTGLPATSFLGMLSVGRAEVIEVHEATAELNDQAGMKNKSQTYPSARDVWQTILSARHNRQTFSSAHQPQSIFGRR
jgi:hypothetical protein